MFPTIPLGREILGQHFAFFPVIYSVHIFNNIILITLYAILNFTFFPLTILTQRYFFHLLLLSVNIFSNCISFITYQSLLNHALIFKHLFLCQILDSVNKVLDKNPCAWRFCCILDSSIGTESQKWNYWIKGKERLLTPWLHNAKLPHHELEAGPGCTVLSL